MANVIYPLWKANIMQGLLSSNIKVVACTSGYVYSASHEFLTSIAGGNRVATSGNITGKVITANNFTCDDVTMTAVTGSTITQIVAYIDTGVEATSRLINLIDTYAGGGAISVTPNGGNITWDINALGLFDL